MNQTTIAILSKYKGAKWAGNSLKDWGKNVIFGSISTATQLIILDSDQEDTYKSHACDKIILKDVDMSPQHILAQSSVLVTFGQQKQFFFPQFIVELTVSNGLAIKALQLLYQKNIKKEEVQPKNHYLSIVALVKYLGAFNISAKEIGMITKPRSQNVLEGGAPYYSVYRCKEGYVSVGNLQPKFYAEMIRGLDLTPEERAICEDGQFSDNTDQLRSILTKKFVQKSASDWEKHYLNYDTCITEIKAPFISKVRQPKLLDLKPRL